MRIITKHETRETEYGQNCHRRIRNSKFPTLTIPPDTYVVWTNCDFFPHAVETDRAVPAYFHAGATQPGE